MCWGVQRGWAGLAWSGHWCERGLAVQSSPVFGYAQSRGAPGTSPSCALLLPPAPRQMGLPRRGRSSWCLSLPLPLL